jgi:hypothetical protein
VDKLNFVVDFEPVPTFAGTFLGSGAEFSKAAETFEREFRIFPQFSTV